MRLHHLNRIRKLLSALSQAYAFIISIRSGCCCRQSHLPSSSSPKSISQFS
ncbi:unnamed protein product [Rhodiola kirilowii]